MKSKAKQDYLKARGSTGVASLRCAFQGLTRKGKVSHILLQVSLKEFCEVSKTTYDNCVFAEPDHELADVYSDSGSRGGRISFSSLCDLNQGQGGINLDKAVDKIAMRVFDGSYSE